MDFQEKLLSISLQLTVPQTDTMRCARKALPFALANLMQAALFGLFHLNWIQGIYAFALGIVLGYVCERGGSIYYSMGLHLLFNLWGTLSGFFPDPGNSVVVFVIVIVVTIVSLVTGFVLFNKGRRKRIVNQSLPEHPINSTGI